MNIIVDGSNSNPFQGTLAFNGKTYPCTLGPNGITKSKAEGDGMTPSGIMRIRKVCYRQDRVSGLKCPFPTQIIGENDGWADDVKDPENYNKPVTLPYSYSHEKLMREDWLYDIIVVLGYNDDPPVLGKGSAIFMHVWRAEDKPTRGCIALSKNNLQEVLAGCTPDTQVEVVLKP